ncbi:MAG: hypothetical protein L3J07_01560 [Candidatus Magasanikbacteria bacterium]|nr:hypothetical protein [Candidatus Magasanikbacteria bacterium]
MKQKQSQLMKKVFKEIKGFSLVEIILSGALFIMLVTTMAGSLIYTKDTTVNSGDRGRATLLAEEAVEALRNIKDDDFTLLTDGTHGLGLVSNQWDLTGTPDVTDNFFTRTIDISSIDTNRKSATTTITWNPRENTTSSYQLGIRLTNWRPPGSGSTDTESSYLTIDTANTYLTNANKRIYGTTLQNTSSTGPITITSMVVSWTGGDPAALLDRIDIAGNTVWSPNIVSGATADITDTVLTSGANPDELRLRFTKDMSGTVVTVEFTMLDGSTKTMVVSFVLSGDEASYLSVNTSTTYLSNGNKRIYGTELSNTAPFGDITVASMVVSWTGGIGGTLLDRIKIGGNTVWNPNIVSGATADITDTVLTSGANPDELRLHFTEDMSGTVVTVEFTMLDGSTKTMVVSFVLSENEAYYLTMDSSGAYTHKGDKRVSGNYLSSLAPFGDITIVEMTITWTGGDPAALLDKIRIGGTNVWNPNVSSGTQVDITDYAIAPTDNKQLRLYFTKSMIGTVITIDFLMLDGSIYTPTPLSF